MELPVSAVYDANILYPAPLRDNQRLPECILACAK
jgi:hypothetical protein